LAAAGRHMQGAVVAGRLAFCIVKHFCNVCYEKTHL
jgi:hypothetical protein